MSTDEQYLDIKDFQEMLEWCCNELGMQADISSQPLITTILQLCTEFRTQLMRELNDRVAVEYNKEKKDIYNVGVVFLFQLRKFLLQEQIVFAIGTSDSSGKISTNYVEQNQIFDIHNLKTTISSEGLIINAELKNLKGIGQSSKNLNNLIKQVVDYGSFMWKQDAGSIKEKTDRYTEYFKNSPDMNVIARYHNGKEHTKTLYYIKSNGTVTDYNNGWLYEWTNNYIANAEQHQTSLRNSMTRNAKTPLIEIMDEYGTKDRVMGIQGGDYRSIINGRKRDVQAKFNAHKIISIAGIVRGVEKIENALIQYGTVYKRQSFKKELVSKFSDQFTSTADDINKNYDKIINKKLKELFNNGQIN